MLGSMQDITERKMSEITLAESEARFRTLANSITQLAWMADAEGWIYWYNERWYEYTGTTLEEMQGWGWEKVHHPEHIDRVVAFVKDAWTKTQPWELIFPLRSADGQYNWFLTRATPVLSSEGKILQWIGTNTNIDEHKRAEVLLEQKVKERTQELELRNRELEQFTYVSHHDLQEPLRKIHFYADMIRAELYNQLPEASRGRFDKITNAASRMSMALRDVLDFASLNKEEQFKEVDLNTIIRDVKTDLELVISEKEAELHFHSLPTIRAVPQQMYQLFYNLINNALKFSKPGVQPFIQLSCSLIDAAALKQHPELNQTRQYYGLVLQDNGIGFDPDAREKIFDMFQRLHSKNAYAGTGIGLALCKKVVTNHKGKIWAESGEHVGATFKLLLPVE
jgi:PAS domain S-box-containing protein